MNDADKVESVFGGGNSASGANGEGSEKDAKIAELERELQKERVEAGRLKKTNEELSALREEVARLKEKNGIEAAIEDVPEDIRESVAPEVLKVSGTMASRMSQKIDDSMARQNEEIRMLREENERRDRNMFVQRLNMEYPGFLDSVGDGGDKHDAWVKYQRYNAGTIVAALKSNDFDTISYHIGAFCRELGVPVPSGKGGSATPDPRANGGGNVSASAVSGKTYTQDEYNNLFDLKEAARDRGDWSEVKRITDEINRAEAEGRVSKE